VFSAAGIIFKGSGYYVTDNRKQDKAASGSKSDGEASKSDGEASKSDDAASKAKADSTSSGPAAESA
jgi:predicted nucleic acid-binding Zn ribbon protein